MELDLCKRVCVCVWERECMCDGVELNGVQECIVVYIIHISITMGTKLYFTNSFKFLCV